MKRSLSDETASGSTSKQQGSTFSSPSLQDLAPTTSNRNKVVGQKPEELEGSSTPISDLASSPKSLFESPPPPIPLPIIRSYGPHPLPPGAILSPSFLLHKLPELRGLSFFPNLLINGSTYRPQKRIDPGKGQSITEDHMSPKCSSLTDYSPTQPALHSPRFTDDPFFVRYGGIHPQKQQMLGGFKVYEQPQPSTFDISRQSPRMEGKILDLSRQHQPSSSTDSPAFSTAANSPYPLDQLSQRSTQPSSNDPSVPSVDLPLPISHSQEIKQEGKKTLGHYSPVQPALYSAYGSSFLPPMNTDHILGANTLHKELGTSSLDSMTQFPQLVSMNTEEEQRATVFDPFNPTLDHLPHTYTPQKPIDPEEGQSITEDHMSPKCSSFSIHSEPGETEPPITTEHFSATNTMPAHSPCQLSRKRPLLRSQSLPSLNKTDCVQNNLNQPGSSKHLLGPHTGIHAQMLGGFKVFEQSQPSTFNISGQNPQIEEKILDPSREHPQIRSKKSYGVRRRPKIKEKISGLSRENQRIKKKILDLSRENQRIKEKILDLSRENQRIKEKILDHSRKNLRIKKKILDLSRENQRIKEKILDLSRENQQIEEKILDHSRENQRIKEKILDLSRKNQRIKENILDLSGENQQIEDKILDLSGEQRRIKTRMRGFSREHRRIKTRMWGFSREHRRIKTRMRGFSREHRRIKTRMWGLSGELGTSSLDFMTQSPQLVSMNTEEEQRATVFDPFSPTLDHLPHTYTPQKPIDPEEGQSITEDHMSPKCSSFSIHSEPGETEPPITTEYFSATNTMPARSHLQLSRKRPLLRSQSLPSLNKTDCVQNNFTRAKSLPDMFLNDSFITVDENQETYRFFCSRPGLYQCSDTGLVFHMKGEGDVVYRIVPWNHRLLTQHHKKPAGPLFDIKCLQQSVCQLHLPHCEIRSTGGCEFLSVAHVKDEGVEFITPHEVTETHVIINITGFSAFGNVKDEDSPPDPVRALVLLFYRPPTDLDPESQLNVLMLPNNVVLRDVQRMRKKLVGHERYIEASPKCKLRPKQEYTLSSSPEDDSVLVQPTEAEFEEDSYDNYVSSFQVILFKGMKHVNLSLRESNSSVCVWERRVGLSSTGAREPCGSSASNEKLMEIRTGFINGISGPVLKSLMDKLLETKVMTDAERESADEKRNQRETARFVIDTVRKKGEAASSEMIECLCEDDPFLCEHLGLM